MTLELGLGLTGVAVSTCALANVLCYAANENSWVSRVLKLPPLLLVSNKRKFADAQPETFLLFDILDPRDLARSFWIGSRGLLLLRVLVVAYFAGTVTLDGLTAEGPGGAYWIAYFTNWSLCLICVSAGAGVLVSLKYLLTSYHTSKVIVHGRPGLTPRYRESQYACGCLASTGAGPTTDVENMIPPDQVGLTDRLTDRHPSSQPLVDASWEMDNTSLESNASTSRDAVSPRGHAVSQLASASVSSCNSESAFVQTKRLCRTPSDLESMAPAELLYDPQSAQWSILEKLHCLVLQTAAVTSTVVLVFYWSVNPAAAIWGPYPDGYLKHVANAPIMLLDVWFSKVPFASYHLQVMILYGSVHEFCMWLYYGASEHWVYKVLNWQTDKPVLVYLLLPIAYVALFFVWLCVVSLRNGLGQHCASHLLCPQCYQRYSHHAAARFQRQEPPDSATGRLKKQSSTIGPASSSRSIAHAGSLGIIAADTRYSGQQILTSVRQNSPSPENPSLMELSRRGSAPRQV